MSTKQQSKNRFLSGSHTSEKVLAKILYYWLHGYKYSEIPEAVLKSDADVDAVLSSAARYLGADFEFAENKKSTTTRQSCHSIINEIAIDVIVASYLDRVPRLESLLNNSEPCDKDLSRRLRDFVASQAGEDAETVLLQPAREQTITQYIQNWGKIVFLISSENIPYLEMRSIEGVKPFDQIENRVILEKIQGRYKRFRGYKIQAMKPHIAHYFSLRSGADLLKRANYSLGNSESKQDWDDIVLHALTVLLLILKTGKPYMTLRSAFLASRLG